MTRALLILWMALVGADRLDLAGGSLPVKFTPYLALTPFLLGALAVRRYRRGQRTVIEQGAIGFLCCVAVFLAAVGASTLASLDASTTLARSALLIMQLGGAAAVAILVHDDRGALDAVRSGATIGVWLFAAMNVLAVLCFLRMLPTELPLGFASLRLDSYGYASIIPRLSGTVLDPNRAGLVLLVYAFLSPRARWGAIALLPLTLSRSAVLAGLALGAVAAWQFGVMHRAAPTRRLLIAVAVICAGFVGIARSPGGIERTAKMLAPFAERFGGGEESGSASSHQSLIVRAAEEGSRTMPRALFGLGWGASYMVLQDLFPGNRYGNFHSLYGTVFAEAGVMALLAMLALLFVPLMRDTPWRPAVAAFIVFNLFYQATTDPAFWFLLALAWVATARRAVQRVAA